MLLSVAEVKNGASLKSHTSRRNFSIVIAFFLVFQSFMADVCYAQYTGDELYPAVYGAIQSRVNGKIKGYNYSDIDFYNNEYKVNVRVNEIGTKTRFDLIIKMEQDGSLDISYENVQGYDSKTKKWKDMSGFAFFGWKKFAAELSAKIYEIANNPKEYEKFEKAAMADITFVYAIMINFTDFAFKDFVENYAKDSVFSLEGFISQVTEAEKEIEGETYKYLVSLTQKLTDEDSPETGVVYCKLYTNRTDVIRLSKTKTLKITAKLYGASQGSMGQSLSLELFSND